MFNVQNHHRFFCIFVCIVFAGCQSETDSEKTQIVENQERDRMKTDTSANQDKGDIPQLPPVRVSDRWPNLQAVLADAPDVPLKPHEFEWRGETYLIDAPENGKVEIDRAVDAEIQLKLADGGKIEFLVGRYDMDERKQIIRRAAGFSDPPKEFTYVGQDLLLYENDTDEPNRFKGYLNVSWRLREFRGRMEDTVKKYGALPLQKCLLLLKCAKSLRVKEPYPDEPIAILDCLDIDYEPATTDPAEVLSLKFPSSTTCAAHVKLVERFPNLQSVTLSVKWLNPVTNDLEPLTRCKKLRKLVIPGDGGRSVSDADAETLAKCDSLEQLDLNSWGLSAKGIASLGQMTNLKSLLLERVDEEGVEGLVGLAGCNSLERFATAFEYSVNDVIPHEEAIAFLSELPKIRSVKLEGQLSDTTYRIIGSLDGLQSLAIKSEEFKDDYLKLLVEAPNVKSFSLEGSTISSLRPDIPFTGEGLADLAQWKSLERLSLIGLPLTDGSLKHLHAAGSLREVYLYGLPISYEGLVHLKDVPELKSLHLVNLENLNRDLIDEFKEVAPQISVDQNRPSPTDDF